MSIRQGATAIVSIVVLFFALTVAGATAPDLGENIVFSEEELVNAVKPAVVRIVGHIEGTASIIPFTVDLKNFTVKAIPNEKPLTIPIKLDIAGSGFVVNPDGYILTNSHIVSDYAIKAAVTEPVVDLIVRYEGRSLTKSEIDKINSEKTNDEGVVFGQEILDYVIEQSIYTINKKITILNPTSNEKTTEDIVATGFPATIISVNENWQADNRDIAILKIEETNLPSLRFGSSDDIVVGSPVYVFGFPSNAEFNRNNLLESTFTKGVVSAVKNSTGNDFKIFQTDAKISTGSSGGPLFDKDGRVTGLISFMTGASGQENGDSFAFAIPIEVAKKPLADDFVTNNEGMFGPHFRAGLMLLHDRRCEQALEEFTAAKGMNGKFGVGRYVDPYMDRCNNLIASGLSIDSVWDEFLEKVRSMGLLVWALLAIGILLIIMVTVGGLMVMRRLRKDKEELVHLEHVIEHTNGIPSSPRTTPASVSQEPSGPGELETVVPAQTVTAEDAVSEITKRMDDPMLARGSSAAGTPDPEVLSYIKRAREAGMTFQQIEVALKEAGWNDNEISRALAVPQ